MPEWREAYNANLPEVTRFYSELGQNLKLFAKYKAIRDGAGFASLSQAQRKIIDNEVRDFRLSGAELPEDQKPRFQQIQEELAGLAAKFSENVLDATNAHAEWVEHEAELAGIPARRAPRRTGSCRKGRPRRLEVHPARARPTFRCCSTPTTATCARACTAPTRRAPPNSASPNGTTPR